MRPTRPWSLRLGPPGPKRRTVTVERDLPPMYLRVGAKKWYKRTSANLAAAEAFYTGCPEPDILEVPDAGR